MEDTGFSIHPTDDTGLEDVGSSIPPRRPLSWMERNSVLCAWVKTMAAIVGSVCGLAAFVSTMDHVPYGSFVAALPLCMGALLWGARARPNARPYVWVAAPLLPLLTLLGRYGMTGESVAVTNWTSLIAGFDYEFVVVAMVSIAVKAVIPAASRHGWTHLMQRSGRSLALTAGWIVCAAALVAGCLFIPYACTILTCALACAFYLRPALRDRVDTFIQKDEDWTPERVSCWVQTTVLCAVPLASLVYRHMSSDGQVGQGNFLGLLVAYIGIPLAILLFYQGRRAIMDIFLHFHAGCEAELAGTKQAAATDHGA
jgi:hypothetical protein